MGGGFAVKALLIVMALLAVGQLLKIKAVVKRSVPASRGSSRAYAEYAVGERKIKGRMICASPVRLTEGQTVKVFISERKPKFFAVDERQIKNAVYAYVVMCLVFLMIAAFLIFIAAERITSG